MSDSKEKKPKAAAKPVAKKATEEKAVKKAPTVKPEGGKPALPAFRTVSTGSAASTKRFRPAGMSPKGIARPVAPAPKPAATPKPLAQPPLPALLKNPLPPLPPRPVAVAPVAPKPVVPVPVAPKPAATPVAPVKPPAIGGIPPVAKAPALAVPAVKPPVPGVPSAPKAPVSAPVARPPISPAKPLMPVAAPKAPTAPFRPPVAPAPKAPPVAARPVPPPPPKPVAPPPKPAPVVPAGPRGKITINENITAKELAEKMNVKLPDVMKKLLGLGMIVNLNQRLDKDAATLVADAFNFDAEMESLLADEKLEGPEDKPEQLKPRPPVVTVMGHVDHGKTSLLDAIRSARVAEKEAGGITQHIGAYQVPTPKGVISFLDTPGHEAFTAMRARGAQATDLVILVVAADDGVMPQTVEALDHAKAAGVPIIVAINKCDLPQANPQRIRQDLTKHGLVAEEWGGKTVMVEVSAKTKKNIEQLLEMVLLESEILELKANPDRAAQAVVVEAKLDPRRGPVATVLVQKGTLRVGDAFVCGSTFGKVRALTDDHGRRIKEAPPAMPAEILGLAGTPLAGDKLMVLASEKESREIGERRAAIAASEARARRHHTTLENLNEEAAAGKTKTLPIIIKGDVQGSVEAIRDSFAKLPSDKIQIRIIHAGVGGINTSDVILADASDAVILGFNVRPDPASEELARRDGVEIRTYRIIYEMIDNVKAAMEGLLSPVEKEVTVGWAEIRQVFRAPKVGAIAGCMVTDGKLVRTGRTRLLRNGTIVFDGAFASLRRFKDDVREVEKGYECGVGLENFQDIKPGDRLEAYIIEKHTAKL